MTEQYQCCQCKRRFPMPNEPEYVKRTFRDPNYVCERCRHETKRERSRRVATTS